MRKLKIKSFLFTRDDNGYKWFSSPSTELKIIQKSMDYFINPMQGLQIIQRFFIKIISQKTYSQILIYNMQNLGTDEYGRPIKILTGWNIESSDFNYTLSNLSILMTYYYDYCKDKTSLIENFKNAEFEIDLNTFIKETLSKNSQLKEFRLKVDILLTDSNWNQIVINELENGDFDFVVAFLKNAKKPIGQYFKKITNLISFMILLFTLCSCGTKKTPQEQHTTHMYSTIWSKNETTHWKECSCGQRNEEENHSFGEWTEIEAATSTKEGLKEATCSICNYKKQEKINQKDPVYEWRAVDVLQPTIIVGGKSKVVLDKNSQKVEFSKLVDRQIDMLAQEIISRIEYVYGSSNANETHTILDPYTNTPFTTYSSMNVFTDSLSSLPKYAVYDRKDNYVEMGYALIISDNKVVYNPEIHSHYFIDNNGQKYAALCSKNIAGQFQNEVALQYAFEKGGKPTLTYQEGSYDHNGILTFRNAIYGTDSWIYATTGTSQIHYKFSLDTTTKTPAWNWATYFEDGSAKDKLKLYLAYLARHNNTYAGLPEEATILSRDYDTLIGEIDHIDNYVTTYQSTIMQILSDRVIGRSTFQADVRAGEMANEIAYAIYKTSTKVDSYQANVYYDNGKYIQLYEQDIFEGYIDIINYRANTNLVPFNFTSARNYKGYNTILSGILSQITKQSSYLSCDPIYYETKESASSITTALDKTEVYLFFKSRPSGDLRIALSVPSNTTVTLSRTDGSTLPYTKENVDGKLVLKIASTVTLPTGSTPTLSSSMQGYGATSSLSEVLATKNYLLLTLENVDHFCLSTTQYIQIN